ncbi:BlaI/MecI/CopY family transcriptional regulator [Paenibacillus faecalis]|uniref:BlaI/MecI/CopY family transcriptional regulator n=1 Tax=Paenibacillus faecalis TaxID=2079532 RepID=UPI000D10C4E9|nr:BlaI/MecI/CopY family transcriptional regulator [Paenibacillus faecalis]
MKIKKLNIHEQGLNQFFGPLEAKIMDILWQKEQSTIRDVQTILNKEESLSFNTVMTVMNRLLEKGILQKRTEKGGRGRTTLFKPVQTKEQFLSEQTKEITQGLIRNFGDLVVGHMIDTLDEADPKLISKLQEKLKQMDNGS